MSTPPSHKTNKSAKKMPCNFGHIPPELENVVPHLVSCAKYCELPDICKIDFHTYNEHHLRNILIGLNSDKPEIVETSNTLLSHYLEFRKTKPDDFIPYDSEYIMPTHAEIIEMMKNKINIIPPPTNNIVENTSNSIP